ASGGPRPSPRDTPLHGGAAGAEPALLPDSLQRYRVERVLGQGAFGTVCLAEDRELNRPVALKVALNVREGPGGRCLPGRGAGPGEPGSPGGHPRLRRRTRRRPVVPRDEGRGDRVRICPTKWGGVLPLECLNPLCR